MFWPFRVFDSPLFNSCPFLWENRKFSIAGGLLFAPRLFDLKSHTTLSTIPFGIQPRLCLVPDKDHTLFQSHSSISSRSSHLSYKLKLQFLSQFQPHHISLSFYAHSFAIENEENGGSHFTAGLISQNTSKLIHSAVAFLKTVLCHVNLGLLVLVKKV